MSKYGFGNFLPLPLAMPFFLFSLLFPLMALCQLSSQQNATMIKLSSLFNNTGVPWDATKVPNPCSWEGVKCGNTSNSSGSSSFVTDIYLREFGLFDSAFLPVVCQLETLQSLDVSDNFLTSIPDSFITVCGGINGLKVLNFTRNKLSGPLPAFTGFGDLETLDLSFNSLGGNVSLQLDGLAALKSLNLSFNFITGPIPMSLSKTMEELVLSMNSFQGNIPVEIGNYQNLRVLDLSSNRNLSGTIPDTIGDLPNLNILLLSLSCLGGEIPANISNISTLKRFAANQNSFTGAIPSGITRFLTSLDLSYNSLSGSIPSDFLSHPNLQIVDMSYNRLDGPIPSKLSPSLYRLRLGSNSLNGTIPYYSFSSLKNLTYLELDNNSLSGQIPAGLGSCQKLALLNLAQNRLTGPLPTLLGNLSKLEVLRLQLNDLIGAIPTEITRLPKLSILNVSWNSLNGSIPSSVSNLQSLSHLNLQGNSLSGPIPDTISGMNSLLELQLGQNHIGGSIPRMPPKLQIALNLSSNLFQGPIPITFAELKDLEVLDLSNNGFSGEIPDFLTTLGSLTQLILSNNELTGVIPNFRPWVSVSASGNPGLRNRTVTPTSMPTSKKSKHIAVAAVLSVAAVVLVAVAVTVLVLSKRFPRVNDEQPQSGEAVPAPQVVHGNLLTANGIHRSNIDFTKAMETVTDPLNIVLKTRFSTYYKATMPAGACYYVKKLNWSDKIFQLGSPDKFEQELEVLGKLSNSNVMTPLAYVLTVDSAYLFYEYAQKGTLFDALHGKLGDALDWASRYSIAVGVAQGLTFLHGCTPNPILLLDLSSRNILLRSLKEPLVGDIELCKVIDPTKSTGSLSAVAGSVGYIPPEYAYTMRVTMAGNVYSFGVTLLELLTGKPAVSEGTELAKWVLSKSAQQDRWDHILDFSISRTSPAVRGQMLAVLKVARSCVSLSPDARPKMKSVLRMILNAR